MLLVATEDAIAAALMDRITVDSEKCGGRPCSRGMRIRITDVLDLLAAGLTTEQILEELPDLERDDVRAALQFASRL
jgi:uncharacterized protein (DUF433 family)